MAFSENKINKRRLRSAYFTSTISIALVLFMLGLVGLLMLNAKKLSDYVKENINFTLVLNADTREVDIIKLQKELESAPYVKTTEYITRERAAREFTQTLGEDFVGFLGNNPLLASIEVKLFAEYTNPDSLNLINKKFQAMPNVDQVIYEKTLITQVNENVKKISIFLLGFSGLLFLIAIALINNMVRLLAFSKRFIIRTMQLVGATGGVIRKPFLIRSLWHGFIASVVAFSLILIMLYFIKKEFPDLLFFTNFYVILILFAGISALGIIINLVCTFFAINKYLYIDIDKLY
jgi:cell division transport system permease protein